MCIRDRLYGFKISVNHLLNNKKREVLNLTETIDQATTVCINKQSSELQSERTKLQHSVNICLERQNNKLILTGNSIKLLDPINTLKRGYSITRFNNNVIRRAAEVTAGDILVTQFEKGEKKSKVI